MRLPFEKRTIFLFILLLTPNLAQAWFLTSWFNAASNWVTQDAVPWVDNSANVAAHAVVGAAETVENAIVGAAETVATAVVHAATAVATFAVGAAETVATFAEGAEHTVASFAESIGTVVATAAVDAAKAVATAAVHAGLTIDAGIHNAADDVVSAVDTAGHWVSNEAGDVWHYVQTGADDVGHWVRTAAASVANEADTIGDDISHEAQVVGKDIGETADEAWHWVKSDAVPWIVKEATDVGDWVANAAEVAGNFIAEVGEGLWNMTEVLAMMIVEIPQMLIGAITGQFEPAEVDEPVGDRTPPPLYDPEYPQYNNCTPGYVGCLDTADQNTLTGDLGQLLNTMEKDSGLAWWNWLRCPGRYNFTTGTLNNWWSLLTEDAQLFLLGYSYNTTQTFPGEANGEMPTPTGPFKSCDGIFYDFDSAVSCDFSNLETWFESITWSDIWSAGKFLLTMALDFATDGVFSGVVNAVGDIQNHNWPGLVDDVITTVFFLVILC